MAEYRIKYHASGTGITGCTTLQTKEFTATDDKEAKSVYEEFKEKMDKANREGKYLTKYYVEGLWRINQREITTVIC